MKLRTMTALQIAGRWGLALFALLVLVGVSACGTSSINVSNNQQIEQLPPLPRHIRVVEPAVDVVEHEGRLVRRIRRGPQGLILRAEFDRFPFDQTLNDWAVGISVDVYGSDGVFILDLAEENPGGFTTTLQYSPGTQLVRGVEIFADFGLLPRIGEGNLFLDLWMPAFSMDGQVLREEQHLKLMIAFD